MCIGVAGAGIAGTAFALALEQACDAKGIIPKPTITIYERDSDPSARGSLGYAFSIVDQGHGAGGLAVNTGLSMRTLQREDCS